MNCPNCGAAMRLEDGKTHLNCDFCGHLHFPEPDADGVRDLDKPAGESCPVCRVGMVHASVDGMRIVHCRQCLGLLIEMESFVALVDALRAKRSGGAIPPRPPDLSELERSVSCPRCSRKMHTHLYGGPGNVTIDNCPECRMNWLDHAELRRIVMAGELVRAESPWLAI